MTHTLIHDTYTASVSFITFLLRRNQVPQQDFACFVLCFVKHDAALCTQSPQYVVSHVLSICSSSSSVDIELLIKYDFV